MSNFAQFNQSSGNVCGDVISAKLYMTSKTMKTASITPMLRGGSVNVDGTTIKNGDVSAKNMTLDGNLEISGVIIGARDLAPQTEAEIRRQQSYQNRMCAAQEQYIIPVPSHENNGDEELYPNYIANFSKGLQHNALGEVDPAAYDAFVAGLKNPYILDQVPKAGPRKWVNPLAGVAFDTEGADSHAFHLPPAPAFASAEQAGEMVEDYWMALLRDVHFNDYSTDPNVAAACADLNAMSDFRGPKVAGSVTPQTLFRGPVAGCTSGPFISQFLYLDCPYGAVEINQKAKVPVAGDDFMKTFPEWLNIQNGQMPVSTQTFDPTRRYLRNGRDLSQWVHIDVLYQAYFHAAIILLNHGCPFNPGNPYITGHQNQSPFGTLGSTDLLATLAEVSTRALKAIWFQKWYVHRRLRPEAFAARVDRHKAGAATYPIHSDVLNSAAVVAVHAANGNYLLPQAFPEGSPTHPSYGAGHATVAGACCTILKAMFDAENFIIPNPKIPNADGTALVDYIGDPLTAAGEINKIGYNVALGRDFAGVHWRSDGTLELGEAVAISVLRDRKKMYHPAENFAGFKFKKFDGTEVVV